MKPFDIFVAYITWGNSGKSRPVLVMEKNGNIYRVFSITTQYQNKSGNIQAKYMEIQDWQQAGLHKKSYIDANKKIDLPTSVVSKKTPIGQLTSKDKLNLLNFLNQIKEYHT